MNVKPSNIVERWESSEDAEIVPAAAKEKHHWSLRYSVRAVVLAAVILPLSFGGKTDLAIGLTKLLIFGFALAISANYIWSAGRHFEEFKLRSPGKLLFALYTLFLGVVILQIVPLPSSLVGILSPQADELYRMTGSEWSRVSVEATTGVSQLFWLIALGLLALWFAALPGETIRTALSAKTRKRQSRDSLQVQARETDYIADIFSRTIIGVGVLCSVIAIVHWTMHSTLLFGVFESRHGPLSQPRAHWPFVNPDHLSVLLEIAIIMAFARFLRIAQLRSLRNSREHTENISLKILQSPGKLGKQLPYGIALLTMILCNVLALSRGGNVLVIFGLLALWWAYDRFPVKVKIKSVKQNVRHTRGGLHLTFRKFAGLKKIVAVVAVLCLVLFFLGQTGRDMAAKRIEYGLASGYDESRKMLSQTSLKVFTEYPLLGIGLGSWHLGAAKYIPRDLAGYSLDYAHNDYLQLLAETGALGSLPVFLGILVILLATRKAWKRPLLPTQRFELLGSLLALTLPLIHALFDFPFHIPGLAFIFVLALVVHLRLVFRALES